MRPLLLRPLRSPLRSCCAQRRYWADDGIHPSDEGYRVWGEHIGMSMLKQALLGAAVAERRPRSAVVESA